MTDKEKLVKLLEIANKPIGVGFISDESFHVWCSTSEDIADVLIANNYCNRSELLKDVFECIIEKTEAVQEAGCDGLSVEDLKNIAKLWYGVEVEE